MNEKLLQLVQISLERRMMKTDVQFWAINAKVSDLFEGAFEDRKRQGEKEMSLYDTILHYIKRLNNPDFFSKLGNIKEAAFYEYALIDKSTWSSIKYNTIIPSKKTLLKLVIALRLNETEAKDLLRKGSNSFDLKDMRDQVILALIDIKCYDITDVYEVLEEYRNKGPKKFDNIY